jgi:inosine triphosphate pyrophosphatase
VLWCVVVSGAQTAYAQCIFAYCSGPGETPQVFVGQTPVTSAPHPSRPERAGALAGNSFVLSAVLLRQGRIVEARGPTDFGWDPIFEPDGFDLTCVSLSWLFPPCR